MEACADVMLVFREADPATGGLGIDVSDVARGMAARGRRVEILTMRLGDRPVPDFGPGVTVHALEPWLDGRPGVAFGLSGGAPRVVRRRSPRVLHLYSCLPVHMHWAAAMAARRAGVPVVWTPMLHPGRRALWRSHGIPGRAMEAWDATAPWAARLSAAVCVATNAEAALFRRMGAPRVALVPPAVYDTPRVCDHEAAEFRAQLGIGNAPLVLCVAGRPDARKGLDFAAEVITALRRRVPGAVLGAVGLPQEVRLAGVSGVRLLGRLSLGDLRLAYRASDAVFVPSLYEAFSRIVIEAWQQARPVVVTDGVALAEEVRHGGGTVVPFGDAHAAASAIAHYVRDPQDAAAAGEHGARVVASRYTLDRVLDRLESVYGEVST